MCTWSVLQIFSDIGASCSHAPDAVCCQAGDAGVTVIVEVIVSWIISAAMVCNDVRTAALGLAPVASSLGMAQSTGKASLGRRVLEGFVSVENMDLLAPRLSLWQRAVRLIRSAFCGFLACIPVFFLWWPVGSHPSPA